MIAFHGDFKLKEKILKRLRDHYEADEIIKGQYWEGGKGCAVGCSVHSSDHMKYEELLGINYLIAHLEDSIFEGLPNEQAKEFPIQFIEAIPVGANLDSVFYKFAINSLKRSRKHITSNFEIYEKIIKLFEEESKDYEAWAEAGLEASRAGAEDSRAGAETWAGAWAWLWAWIEASGVGASRAWIEAGLEAEACAEASRAEAGAGAGVEASRAWAGVKVWAEAGDEASRAGAGAVRIQQRDDLLELLKETRFINTSQCSDILGISEPTLRKKLSNSKYDILKQNKKKVGSSVFYDVEDIFRIKN